MSTMTKSIEELDREAAEKHAISHWGEKVDIADSVGEEFINNFEAEEQAFLAGVKYARNDCDVILEAVKDVIRNSNDILARKRCSQALFKYNRNGPELREED